MLYFFFRQLARIRTNTVNPGHWTVNAKKIQSTCCSIAPKVAESVQVCMRTSNHLKKSNRSAETLKRFEILCFFLMIYLILTNVRVAMSILFFKKSQRFISLSKNVRFVTLSVLPAFLLNSSMWVKWFLNGFYKREKETLSKLFFVFQNSLLFDKSIVFPCMFRKTSKINQILRKKS